MMNPVLRGADEGTQLSLGFSFHFPQVAGDFLVQALSTWTFLTLAFSALSFATLTFATFSTLAFFMD